MAQSFADLDRKLGRVVADLNGEVSRAGLARVGKKLERQIDQAVAADIGDTSMSGWRRGAPIAVVGTSRAISDHAVIVEPVKPAKGPMAVLERGRNMGSSAWKAPGVKKDGTLKKVRKRKARRWNGVTPAKETMSEASQAIKDKAPRLIAGEVHKALGKHLRGG